MQTTAGDPNADYGGSQIGEIHVFKIKLIYKIMIPVVLSICRQV